MGKKFENALTLSVDKREYPSAPGFETTEEPERITVLIRDDEYKDCAEFSISEAGSSAEAKWQSSNVFEGLKPNTDYVVSVRYRETDEYKVSAMTEKDVATPKYRREAPDVETLKKNTEIEQTSFSIPSEEDLVLECSGANLREENGYWVANNLIPNRTYTVKAYYAETDTHYKSAETELQIRTLAKEADIIIGSLDTVYNGQQQGVSVTMSDGNTNFTVTYFDASEEKLEGLPVHASVYTVQVRCESTEYGDDGLTETATFTIAQKEITVAAHAQNIVYGDENVPLTYTAEGLIEGDALSGALARTEGDNAGVYPISQGTLGNTDYKIAFVGADYTIKKAKLTARVSDASADYGVEKGKENFQLAFTGFVCGEDSSVLNGVASFSVSPEVKDIYPVGVYTVRAGGLTSENYEIEFVDGKFTVNALSIDLDYEEKQSLPYNGEVQGFGVEIITEGEFELQITYSRNDATCEPKDAGVYRVTIYFAGDGVYEEFTKYGELTITPKEITVTADAKQKTYKEEDPELTYTADGLIEGDVLSGALARAEGENAGEYPILQGTLANPNYTVAFNGATFTIHPKEITVTAKNTAKAAGTADPVFEYEVSPEIDETLNGALSRESGEEEGKYSINEGTLQQENPNYAIDFISAELEIVGQVAVFNYDHDRSAFDYRIGTANIYTVPVEYQEGYTQDTHPLTIGYKILQGNPWFETETAWNDLIFSGEGVLELQLLYALPNGVLAFMDTMRVEVVKGALNVTDFSGFAANNDYCLHSDLVYSGTGITVAAGHFLYGNDYTVLVPDDYNPVSHYVSIITLYGTIENLSLIGRYAEGGQTTDFYKTMTGITMYGNAALRYCHVKDSRYGIRYEGSNCLIDHCTLEGGVNSIYIRPNQSKQTLTVRDTDFIQNAADGRIPGIAVYVDNSDAKNLTLRFEGDIGFYCMLTQDEVGKIPTIGSIIGTYWGDFKEVIHTDSTGEYVFATVAQYKSEGTENLNIDYTNSNLNGKFAVEEQSAAGVHGIIYTYKTGTVTEEEMAALRQGPAKTKNGGYAPLRVYAAGGYAESVEEQIAYGEEFVYSYADVSFEKYKTELPYTVSVKKNSANGTFDIDESAKTIAFTAGSYTVLYSITDTFADAQYEYQTTVTVTDTSPAPIIVFTYPLGRGSGTAEDPYQWQGVTKTDSLVYRDFYWDLDLFAGVHAFDSKGNSLPRINFKIEAGGVTHDNVNEAFYESTSHNKFGGAQTVTATYTVMDANGKSTTATRYFIRNSTSESPENNNNFTVTRKAEGQLGEVNIGEISVAEACTVSVNDGKTQQIFKSDLLQNAQITNKTDPEKTGGFLYTNYEMTITVQVDYKLPGVAEMQTHTEDILVKYTIGMREDEPGIRPEADCHAAFLRAVTNFINSLPAEQRSGFTLVFDSDGSLDLKAV